MKRKTVYLAGGMEAASELGSGWRSELTPFLEGLNLEVLNPCLFEAEQLRGFRPNRLPTTHVVNGVETPLNYWHELKNSDNKHLYKRFLNYMQRIIAFDINVVQHNTDIVICYWDESTGKGAGTHSELTTAFLSGVPVYCVAACDMPAWSKGCCDKIFLNFEDLKKYLTKEYAC